MARQNGVFSISDCLKGLILQTVTAGKCSCSLMTMEKSVFVGYSKYAVKLKLIWWIEITDAEINIAIQNNLTGQDLAAATRPSPCALVSAQKSRTWPRRDRFPVSLSSMLVAARSKSGN